MGRFFEPLTSKASVHTYGSCMPDVGISLTSAISKQNAGHLKIRISSQLRLVATALQGCGVDSMFSGLDPSGNLNTWKLPRLVISDGLLIDLVYVIALLSSGIA